MTQAGARPMTSVQYLLESLTHKLIAAIAKTVRGAPGLGPIYTKTIFGTAKRH